MRCAHDLAAYATGCIVETYLQLTGLAQIGVTFIFSSFENKGCLLFAFGWAERGHTVET